MYFGSTEEHFLLPIGRAEFLHWEKDSYSCCMVLSVVIWKHGREELELRNQSCSRRLSGQFCLQWMLIWTHILSSQLDTSPRTP